ncbi:MAG TPA: hypothetical protein VLW48_01095 [Candidatus Bathyarchaeia archaeon]|nr:hypothetical protein [Candidatus Bathyarchaeia archaeon]
MRTQAASSAALQPCAIASPADAMRTSQQLWRKVFSFPVLLAMTLGASVFVFDSGSIADPDIWWHLRNAEVFVQTHSVVHQDLYSFTVNGARWINEAWLGELPYYFAWEWLGIRGIYLVMLFEVELILLGVFALAYIESRNVKAAFCASWLAVWLATVSFGPRTLLAGWMCLVAELLIFAQFKRNKDLTWLLPPLFALWSNLHGSWLIGMVLFGMFAASGLVEGVWGRLEATRWTPARLRKLALVGALSIAGLFFNPYTYHLVSYPFNFAFRQRLNVNHVDEWMSLDFHGVRGKILFGMLAATIVLALVRKRHWRLDELAFTILGFYAAVTYSRFLFLAAIVVTPMLAKELNFLAPYRREIDKVGLNAALMLAIVLGCILRFPSRDYLLRDTVRNYPVQAMSYLRQFHPEGRVFNDCLWGGYLIWNARRIPVFIDSRIDIFEYNGVFADYLDAMGGKNTLEVLDKYRIRYVLYRRESLVAYLLMHNAGWKVDYKDGTTVLLERVAAITVP